MKSMDLSSFHDEFIYRFDTFIEKLCHYMNSTSSFEDLTCEIVDDIETWLTLDFEHFREGGKREMNIVVALYLIMRKFGKILDESNWKQISYHWLEEMALIDDVYEVLLTIFDKEKSKRLIRILQLMIKNQNLMSEKAVISLFKELFTDKKNHLIIRTSLYKSTVWFNKESYEDFIDFVHICMKLQPEYSEETEKLSELLIKIKTKSHLSDYKKDEMLLMFDYKFFDEKNEN